MPPPVSQAGVVRKALEDDVSETSTRITDEHFRYIAARTQQEDNFLRELKRAARAAGIPAIWIAPEQASCLQILLRACGAREVIEVGTLAGVSAIVMARALGATGRVRTLEIDPARADFAAHWIARSDVAGRVQVLRGDAAALLPTFAAHSADAVFLDADKSGYPLYLEQCLRIVRPGGLILVDNAFAFGQLLDPNPTDRDVDAIRAFNDLLAAQPGVQGVIVPLGDGLWVCVKD